MEFVKLYQFIPAFVVFVSKSWSIFALRHNLFVQGQVGVLTKHSKNKTKTKQTITKQAEQNVAT